MNFKKPFLFVSLSALLMLPTFSFADVLSDNNYRAQSGLEDLVLSAETFAKEHAGKYPKTIEEMTDGPKVYLKNNLCGKDVQGYHYTCTCAVDGKGCLFVATPIIPGKTGSEVKQKKTGTIKPEDFVKELPPSPILEEKEAIDVPETSEAPPSVLPVVEEESVLIPEISDTEDVTEPPAEILMETPSVSNMEIQNGDHSMKVEEEVKSEETRSPVISNQEAPRRRNIFGR